MKDKAVYKYGMHGDRSSMGKKAVHKKMGDYFPQQSDYLTEDGRAIDASKPEEQKSEAGEGGGGLVDKKGKSYTQDQVNKMSDRKQIRKGLRPGVEGDDRKEDPTKYKYKFDLKGNIKKDVSIDAAGNEVVVGNLMKSKQFNFTIGGNREDNTNPSLDLSAELPKKQRIKQGKSKTKSHYLGKGGKQYSSTKTTKRHKKGFTN